MAIGPTYSVIIPVYNEGAHITTVVGAIASTLGGLDPSHEIILVDDGSKDDTWAAIRQASKLHRSVYAVRLSRNFGKEAALCAGLDRARGHAVVVMDGDLQHPPGLIHDMARIWSLGQADIIEAVKEDAGKRPFVNRIGARLFYAILNRFSGYDLQGASDFKLMDRRVVEAWRKMGERNVFFRGMIVWLGLRREQIRFSVPERVGGPSRWSIFSLVRLALTAVTAFSTIPLHFVTLTGVGFFIFAVLLGAQTLYRKLAGTAVSGFTTVILLSLITGSAIMVALGIIGEYISRIYEEVKGRPRYIVAEEINPGNLNPAP